MSNTENDFMKPSEVAELLKVSTGWVYSHANGNREPQIPRKKIGGTVRFLRSEIMAWVHQNGNEALAG